jgi:hypothetical protein
MRTGSKRPLKPICNPIVWHRDKWRWQHRNCPKALCLYEWWHGRVALLRMFPMTLERRGMRDAIRRLAP